MTSISTGPNCPLPDYADGQRVTLAHGEGGRLMRQLIRDRILRILGGRPLQAMSDSATLPAVSNPLAMTTDSFVVSPLEFPGGDIGKLAVFGTVNDLAVAGARPRWLSLALIIEEGLPLSTLDRILRSVALSAKQVGVTVITGDTKVVPRGAADGLFINTTGVGELIDPVPPGPSTLQVDDQLIVSGPVGRHGMAIIAAREDLGFSPPPVSDCAPLFEAVEALQYLGVPVRAMRDATRGGVAAVLHEWAESCGLTLVVDEELIPVDDQVRGACELLGLDPIHVANEGTMLVAVPESFVNQALELLHQVSVSSTAVRIGRVRPRELAPVLIRHAIGTETPLDEPAGAPLPRIC